MNSKYVMWAVLILVGVVAAPKIRSLPLMNKLPTIG